MTDDTYRPDPLLGWDDTPPSAPASSTPPPNPAPSIPPPSPALPPMRSVLDAISPGDVQDVRRTPDTEPSPPYRPVPAPYRPEPIPERAPMPPPTDTAATPSPVWTWRVKARGPGFSSTVTGRTGGTTPTATSPGSVQGRKSILTAVGMTLLGLALQATAHSRYSVWAFAVVGLIVVVRGVLLLRASSPATPSTPTSEPAPEDSPTSAPGPPDAVDGAPTRTVRVWAYGPGFSYDSAYPDKATEVSSSASRSARRTMVRRMFCVVGLFFGCCVVLTGLSIFAMDFPGPLAAGFTLVGLIVALGSLVGVLAPDPAR